MKKEHPFVVKLRCRILKNNPKEPFMSIVNTLALESNRQIKINFDGGDLSSDAGLLLIKEFVNKRLLNYLFHICHNFAKFFPADDLYNIHTTFIQPGQNTSCPVPGIPDIVFSRKVPWNLQQSHLLPVLPQKADPYDEDGCSSPGR